MTTKEIADRLVELCRKGQFEQAQKELYAEDAASIEPDANSGFPKETYGLENIIEKGNLFQSMIQSIISLVLIHYQVESFAIKPNTRLPL